MPQMVRCNAEGATLDADWGAERADSHSLTTTSITANLLFNHIAIEIAWIMRGTLAGSVCTRVLLCGRSAFQNKSLCVNYFTDGDGNLSQTPLVAALKNTRDQPGL